ncbi:hypothetical protein [Streptomyces olivaceus]|uniref:hypothetical protein n=1 Tax=Streptomyces olivaceus TaxID=47716 RepID=UPI0037224ED7
MFRRNRTSRPQPQPVHRDVPRVEYVPLTLTELEAYERVMLHAAERVRIRRPDIGGLGHHEDVIAALYRSAGAASVTEPDPEKVRIPIQKGDFLSLKYAIWDIETYGGRREIAREARHLLNRCNALLGRERAVVHMGGTPVFDPDAPAPVVLDAVELPRR